MGSVQLDNVQKSFGAVQVIKGVDLTIDQGEFVTFVGPSGSGKSTLLRMVAGLETVSDGAILIDGQDVTYLEPAERGIAMVFQSYALYPHMTVRKNIAFNLRVAGLDKRSINERVEEAAQILRLDSLLDRMPAQLSGGQRQRVAIGRSIVRKPSVFLFDEPLSNLDAALRVQMRLEIEKLHRTLGATMIYVTHDQVEAMTLSDRIVALEDGTIQQVAEPLEMYSRPSNIFVAEFIGSPKMNILPLAIAGATASVSGLDHVSFTVPNRIQLASGKGSIGFRPENIKIGEQNTSAGQGEIVIPARIETVERLGNVSFVYADAGLPDLITIQLGATAKIRPEAAINLKISIDQLHFFDDTGRCRGSPLSD